MDFRPLWVGSYGICFTGHIAQVCMAIKGNNMHSQLINVWYAFHLCALYPYYPEQVGCGAVLPRRGHQGELMLQERGPLGKLFELLLVALALL